VCPAGTLWEDLVHFDCLIWYNFIIRFGAYFMCLFSLNLYADLVQFYVPI